jgi:hypothetical protein
MDELCDVCHELARGDGADDQPDYEQERPNVHWRLRASGQSR